MRLLLAEFIRSRNGKQWPVTWFILWLLFALRLLDRGGREKYLGNFVNGVFLHFTGICIYAWLHRNGVDFIANFRGKGNRFG